MSGTGSTKIPKAMFSGTQLIAGKKALLTGGDDFVTKILNNAVVERGETVNLLSGAQGSILGRSDMWG